MSAEEGQTSANLGTARGNSVNIWPKIARFGLDLASFGRIWSTSGHIWAIGRSLQGWRPKWSRLWATLRQIPPNVPKRGQALASLSRGCERRVSNMCLNGRWNWLSLWRLQSAPSHLAHLATWPHVAEPTISELGGLREVRQPGNKFPKDPRASVKTANLYWHVLSIIERVTVQMPPGAESAKFNMCCLTTVG